MLKIHDDVISATNDLIKKTDVHHEKQIQWLEKEIHQKDAMNMVMQEVPIKLIHSTWNIVDVLNNKFDEMLIILDEIFTDLKAQALTTEAYEALTKQLNKSFQWVFEWLEELKIESLLASEADLSHARGGEREWTIQWKLVLDFML